MATFTLAGETFEFVRAPSLTFGEARSFEEATGFAFADLTDPEHLATRSSSTTQALMWLSMKRVKPEVKFSDLDSLSLADVEWERDEEPEDPTPGEDSPSGG
jgi:hypothetical protein